MGNTDTKAFRKWWLIKTGVISDNLETLAMNAGTNFEHRILDALGIVERDRQFLIPELRLRVNLDGNTEDTNCEVKTYKLYKGFKLPKKYVQQVQVQMFGSGLRKSVLYAYGLKDEDYKNYFNPIDLERILSFPINYDKDFVQNIYLPKLTYFAYCLEKGVLPSNEDYNRTAQYNNGFKR